MSEREATLSALLERRASDHRDAVALYDRDGAVTFGALADRVARLAAGLDRLGVGPGDVVAVWLPNSVAWLEAAFAVCLRGAVVLGVNTRYRAVEVQHALAESGARVLVTRPGFLGIDFLGMLAEIGEALPATLEHVVAIGEGGGGPAPEVPPTLGRPVTSWSDLARNDPTDTVPAPDPDAPGLAFSSSGSTASPKLVLHSQRATVQHSEAVADAFGYAAPHTVVLGALPVCGVFGLNSVLAALAVGRPVVLQEVFSADGAVELIRRHAVTHVNLADEMLARILAAADPATLPTWRETGFGNFTAVDPLELVRAGDSAGKKFFQTYGSSEVFALLCYPAPGADAERRARGGGVPVSERVGFRIRDTATGLLAAPGDAGEIEIAGPTLTVGYLNRPGIDDLGPDGWFRTGDIGVERPGRDLEYLSRMGDSLRLAGFLVSPREIEAFLEDQPDVVAAQLVGVETGNGTVPVAFVLASGPVDERTVIDRCRSSLAGFKVPRRVLVLDEFPVVPGTNGDKIQRTVLRELGARALAPTTGHGPAREDGDRP